MQLIIEARLVGDDVEPGVAPIPLAVIDRYDGELQELGLSIDEGKALLAAAQCAVVSSQASLWMGTQTHCRHCHTPLLRKDSRSIVMRTVFGKVAIDSPRFWSCACQRTFDGQSRTFSPLSQTLPKRVTPELEYLQTKWAAHLSYATSTSLLQEILPLEDGISASGARHRIRVTGEELDIRIEQDIAIFNTNNRPQLLPLKVPGTPPGSHSVAVGNTFHTIRTQVPAVLPDEVGTELSLHGA